jgi:hypothetical protein
MFIPYPDYQIFHPGSKRFRTRIRIKEFKYFYPKKFFLRSRKMFIPDPELDFYLSQIPDPGVKKALDPGSATLLIRFE